MENAVDALKLGAAVLIFVLALSVSVTAFSEARIASSTLLDYRDREFWLGSSDYWYSEASNQTRTVGKESIIPSILILFNIHLSLSGLLGTFCVFCMP